MRQLVHRLSALSASDGNGVKIQRLAGRQMREHANPFLMLDEIKSDNAADYIGGFPEHPHRGFETITYMKAGKMRHRDHMGNEGVIDAGDVQWMRAGAGVLHSEMPEQNNGLLHGFQLWLNLPASEKMQAAAYDDIPKSSIATHHLDGGGRILTIAGSVSVDQQLMQGPLPQRSTQPVLIDVGLEPNESVELSFNPDAPAMVYVYSGETDVLHTQQLGFYSEGSHLTLRAGATGTGCLVLSARPIDEPVVQYGPFVMNSREEINKAIQDFQDPAFLASLASENSDSTTP